jgi:hypothetical protein
MTELDGMMKHQFAAYDFNLNYIGSHKGSDFLSEIRGSDAFLLDTNSAGVKIAREFPLMMFVLGRTVMVETENPFGAHIKPEKVADLNNLYVFETLENNRGFVLGCVNEDYISKFCDMPKALSDLTQEERDEFNSPKPRAELLGIAADERKKPVKQRKCEIENMLRQSLGYFSCAKIALKAYSLYLDAPSRKQRKVLEKVQSNHPNALGDTYLVQEALFLGLPILSDDSDVRAIAGFAGVEVVSRECL